MLIVTINYPETSTIFIDRFLATAEAYRVPVKLIFNKTDRYNEDDTRYMDALINLYTYIGYPCFKVSALNNIGTDEVKKDLEGKVTLLSGNSGVGKSTLINAILPEQTLKTGEISDYHNKGMHTTTFSEMFPVDGGGYIIDTPGIKGFGTFDMEEEEVGHYFKEIFEYSAHCKYETAPTARARMRRTRCSGETSNQRVTLYFLPEYVGRQGRRQVSRRLLKTTTL